MFAYQYFYVNGSRYLFWDCTTHSKNKHSAVESESRKEINTLRRLRTIPLIKTVGREDKAINDAEYCGIKKWFKSIKSSIVQFQFSTCNYIWTTSSWKNSY